MRAPLLVAVVATALAATAVAASAVAASAVAAASQDDAFRRGNDFYQEGRYGAAVEAYRSVLGAGVVSAEVHYNLANAHFKAGDLGRAILHWERALALDAGHADARSNLELARTLTADDIEPLPTFWLVAAVQGWIDLLPRPLLLLAVAAGWVALWGGWAVRILARGRAGRRLGGVVALTGAGVLVLLAPAVAVREFGVGAVDRAVVLAEAVPVRSAPTDDDNLTLFEVHEGTSVRIGQRTDAWAEIVLADGKVGWVRADAFEVI